MPLPVILFAVAFAAMVLWVVAQKRRAGPNQLGERDLARAVAIQKSTASQPDPGWTELGSKTTAEGLSLRFDHDDDPQAEASYYPRASARQKRASLANTVVVRLPADFETHHAHTGGYVFRVRLRGTGSVVGKQIKLKAHIYSDGSLHCGRVENDDDLDAAVGGWIEFESLELLRAGR